jgi:protein SCO1/2
MDHSLKAFHMHTSLLSSAALAAALVLTSTGPAGAHEDHSGHQVSNGLVRSEHAYAVPAVRVTRADGKRMALSEAIDDGRPVLMNFIFTTCNAICPVTSQVLMELRDRLGEERAKVNMVSISIDPEQDTPARLSEYAQRFGAAGQWSHFTSSSSDAVAIQRAFGAWRGDKMNHQPTTYLRVAPGKPWVRLDGLYSPNALLTEFRKMTAQAVVTDRCSVSKNQTALASQPAGSHASTNLTCPS